MHTDSVVSALIRFPESLPVKYFMSEGQTNDSSAYISEQSIIPIFGQMQPSTDACTNTCAALGDSTGYITAPVIGSGTFTYLHDTAVKGTHII